MIGVYVDGATPTIAKLEALPEKLNEQLIRRLSYESEIVADKIRANASGGVVEEQTGRLADSVQALDVEVSGASASVKIIGAGGDAFYGKILERGTKEYPIDPRYRAAGTISPKGRKLRARAGAHALKFIMGGGVVFAKHVEHLAIAKHKWFSSVLDEYGTQFVENVAADIDKVLEE